MTTITKSHRASFERQYRSLPEVQRHHDEGVDVLESFVDAEGNEHYCHQHPRDALEKWLLENPEDQRDIRKELVDEFVGMSLVRRDITLYSHFAQFEDKEPVRNPQAEAIYMTGVKDAICNLISMTDDRGGAKWCLTTAEGKVVPFCNPKDKEYMDTPGLIVMFHDAINS